MNNDTHGVSGEGWYGFDLDGTLATYDKWRGIDNIGDPVERMVDLVNELHKDGKRIKILTARVSPRSNPETKPNPYGDEYRTEMPEDDARLKTLKRCPWLAKAEWTAEDFVKDWCDDNLDFVPEITHEKDHLMLELYDDRVKQVVPNEGLLVEDLLGEARSQRDRWKEEFRVKSAEKSDAQAALIREMKRNHSGLVVSMWAVLTVANVAAAAIQVFKVFCK